MPKIEEYKPTKEELKHANTLFKRFREDYFFSKWQRKLLYESQMKVWSNWEKK